MEPDSQPADLAERLVAHGLTYYEGVPGMAADLLALHEEESTPTDLINRSGCRQGRFEPLDRDFREELRAHRCPLGERHGRALWDLSLDLPLRHYVGLLEGKPVAASQLFLGAGVAGIYCVGTVPEARRQGIGAAMTLAALRDARALGYRVGILHSSAMGFPVYQRLGFRELCRMSKFEWQAKPE